MRGSGTRRVPRRRLSFDPPTTRAAGVSGARGVNARISSLLRRRWARGGLASVADPPPRTHITHVIPSCGSARLVLAATTSGLPLARRATSGRDALDKSPREMRFSTGEVISYVCSPSPPFLAVSVSGAASPSRAEKSGRDPADLDFVIVTATVATLYLNTKAFTVASFNISHDNE